MLGARAAGAAHVVGLDPLSHKRELGARLGCEATFDANAKDVVEQVKEATGGGVDYAVECVGKVEAMELAYAITRRGGTTVTSGLSHPDHKIQIQHVNMVVEERTMIGAYLGSCVPGRDIPHYIDLFQQGRLPVDQLISKTIKLDEVNEGFDALADGDVVRQIIAF